MLTAGKEAGQVLLSIYAFAIILLVSAGYWVVQNVDWWYLSWTGTILSIVWDAGCLYLVVYGETQEETRRPENWAQSEGPEPIGNVYWLVYLPRLTSLHFQYGEGQSLLDCTRSFWGTIALASTATVLLVEILEAIRVYMTRQDISVVFQFLHTRRRFISLGLIQMVLHAARGVLYTTYLYRSGWHPLWLGIFAGLRIAALYRYWHELCTLIFRPEHAYGEGMSALDVADICPVCHEKPTSVRYIKPPCQHPVCQPCATRLVRVNKEQSSDCHRRHYCVFENGRCVYSRLLCPICRSEVEPNVFKESAYFDPTMYLPL